MISIACSEDLFLVIFEEIQMHKSGHQGEYHLRVKFNNILPHHKNAATNLSCNTNHILGIFLQSLFII